MNQRILEIAFKLFDEDDQSEPGTYIQLNVEKFAELIVRECARALDDKLSNPNGASMAWCDGSDLLKHFGVEE